MTYVFVTALGLGSTCLVLPLLLLYRSRGRVSENAATVTAPAAASADVNLGLIQRVQELVQLIREQIGEHSASVTDAGESLRRIQQQPSALPMDEVMEVLNVVLAKNTQLEERLQATDRELCRQTELLEQQRHVALTDPLTGLGNRRAFDEEFQGLRLDSSPLGIVLLDLDRFKTVNDTHGHAAGDAVLVQVATILRQAVRRDAFVARMGGEEFALLVPQASAEGLARISHRVREAIELGCTIHEGQAIAVTASVGAALEKPDEVPAELYNRADRAMYASKQAGRNCCRLHAGATIKPVPSEREAAPPLTPAAVGLRLASRMELMAQIRRHLLEADLEVTPLTLVLLEIDCHEDLKRRALDLEDPRFQGALWAICESVREDDIIAECDPHRVAVLLPGAPGHAESGPILRLSNAVAGCLAKCQKSPLEPALGVAQATLDDDCVSFVRRAECELQEARQQVAGV